MFCWLWSAPPPQSDCHESSTLLKARRQHNICLLINMPPEHVEETGILITQPNAAMMASASGAGVCAD